MNSKLAAEAKRLALGGLGDALVMMVDDDPLLIEMTQAFLQGRGLPPAGFDHATLPTRWPCCCASCPT